jgi:hypothetical protein
MFVLAITATSLPIRKPPFQGKGRDWTAIDSQWEYALNFTLATVLIAMSLPYLCAEVTTGRESGELASVNRQLLDPGAEGVCSILLQGAHDPP